MVYDKNIFISNLKDESDAELSITPNLNILKEILNLSYDFKTSYSIDNSKTICS